MVYRQLKGLDITTYIAIFVPFFSKEPTSKNFNSNFS